MNNYVYCGLGSRHIEAESKYGLNLQQAKNLAVRRGVACVIKLGCPYKGLTSIFAYDVRTGFVRLKDLSDSVPKYIQLQFLSA